MSFVYLIFSLCAVAAVVVAQQSSDQERRLREMLKMPVVYTVPGMDQVQISPGLVYRDDAGISLHMDVYRPANLTKTERRPAVLFLHGGVNLASTLPPPAEWGVFQSYGRLMAASGLIGVTFNQRV